MVVTPNSAALMQDSTGDTIVATLGALSAAIVAAIAAAQAAIVAAVGALPAALPSAAAPLGQALMAASVPVAIASNQTAVPVSQSGAWTVTIPTPVPVTDNGGSLTVDGTVTIQEPLSVDDNGGSLTVDGTVTANQGTSPWVGNTTQLGGTNIAVNTGNASNGTQRVVLATDQPAGAFATLAVSSYQKQLVPNGTITNSGKLSKSTSNLILASGSYGVITMLAETEALAGTSLYLVNDANVPAWASNNVIWAYGATSASQQFRPDTILGSVILRGPIYEYHTAAGAQKWEVAIQPYGFVATT